MATGYGPQQLAAVRQQTMLQQQLAMGHAFRTPHPAVPGMAAQMEMSQMAVRRPPMGYSPMHGHDKMALNPMANPVIQQQWLQARMMREGATGAPTMMDELGGASMFPHTPHNRFPPGQGNVHQRLLHAGIPNNILQHHRPDERKLIMEPMEEDDLDDEASEKQLASARYRRNHLLLADVFSDVMVPDPKPGPSEARLKTIQQHYGVLEKQKVALEEELATLENNFSDVKAKMASDRQQFEDQLKKVKENPDACVLPVPQLPVDLEAAVITTLR